MNKQTYSKYELYDYRTNESIRMATIEEWKRSMRQASRDGGAGVIEVEINGTPTDCFVMDHNHNPWEDRAMFE